MAYAELAEGRDFAPLFSRFQVSEENTRIIRRIIDAQSGIYAANKGAGEDIFVSLPFCPTKCEYCSFITAPMSAVERYTEQYTQAVISEIESLKPLITRINSVYVGGGTPFCLENSQLTVEKQIMQPKADYFDELVDRNLLTSFRETAKQFGIKEKSFINFLLSKKYIYRDKKGKLVPYAEKNNGLFELKESFNEKTHWAGTQTLITPKGRETFRLLCEGLN